MLIKRWPICLFLFCLCIQAFGQKIQYSRQTVNISYPDAIELVPNIAGHHHVLCFSANQSPKLSVFGTDLALQNKKELEGKVKDNSDIRIVPFANYYFLYTHTFGTRKHDVWKIDGDGNVRPLSDAFQQMVDSLLNGSSSTLQLINDNGRLCMLSHVYYDGVKNIRTTLVQLDENLQPIRVQRVLFPFNNASETLQQTSLLRDHLFMLKSTRDPENGNLLQLMKADLQTGDVAINTFNSSSMQYVNPLFEFIAKDSSFLLYSMLREPASNFRLQRNIFISRLDFSLQEKVPVVLLKNQFRENTAANFILLDESQPLWLKMYNESRPIRFNGGASTAPEILFEDNGITNVSRSRAFGSFYTNYNQPSAVRLSSLNNQLQLVKDSLCGSAKDFVAMQPRPSAQFSVNNKAYLILVQNFTSKKHGLMLISKSNDHNFLLSDLTVYDRYEYLLPDLKEVNNQYVLIPYTNNKELGLVKLSFAD